MLVQPTKVDTNEGNYMYFRITFQDPIWISHRDQRFSLPSFQSNDGTQHGRKSSKDETSHPSDRP